MIYVLHSSRSHENFEAVMGLIEELCLDHKWEEDSHDVIKLRDGEKIYSGGEAILEHLHEVRSELHVWWYCHYSTG